MLKVVRFVLVAVATLSTVLLAGPAMAGMVATPSQDDSSVQRELAVAALKAQLDAAGVDGARFQDRIDRMETDQIVALSANVQSLQHAGTWWVAGLIALGVIILVILFVMETFYP